MCLIKVVGLCVLIYVCVFLIKVCVFLSSLVCFDQGLVCFSQVWCVLIKG